ncbi:hypothetical protein ACK8N7_13375 [Streptomyces griseobrunneus]
MKNFKVRWVEDGRERVSVVAYDERSAERRAEELGPLEGVSNVRVVPVAPGA